jgi:hypothetical protein
MSKRYTVVVVAALLILPSLASAADKCPTELSQAKAMLSKATAAPTKAPRQLAGAKSQDIQAPRTGSQDIQAPRTGSQDIQAPRTGSQDIQAPRTGSQDIQAPRTGSQDIQAPRTGSQDIQAPRGQASKAISSSADEKARFDKVRKLISDAEVACKRGDMALSTSKAQEAMGLLK